MGGIPKKGSAGVYFGLEAVCRIVALDSRTLRLYERRGLVRVRWVRAPEGGRTALFAPAELRRLRRIRLLTREMGVNLAGVEIILRLLDRLESGRGPADEEG
jgi:MerR family transcriptional regulator/heat shock protein HspR